MNSFLSWVFTTNFKYDQLERSSRHHIIIHVWILIMVIAGFCPMILSLTNDIDAVASAKCMLIVCGILVCLFRVPYKKGLLNKYIVFLDEK